MVVSGHDWLHDEIERLIDDKQAEISARIPELTTFVAQLDSVREILESSPASAHLPDRLNCCVPTGPHGFVPIEGLTASLH